MSWNIDLLNILMFLRKFCLTTFYFRNFVLVHVFQYISDHIVKVFPKDTGQPRDGKSLVKDKLSSWTRPKLAAVIRFFYKLYIFLYTGKITK